MAKKSDLSSLGPIVAAPLSLMRHFAHPTSAVHKPPAGLVFIDPTDPGHDYLNDPEPPARGFLARILGR